MPSIHTLLPDIQELLKRKDGWMSAYKDELGKAVADKLEAQFIQTQSPGLRLSKMGPTCPRALWYSVHKPEEAEPLPPWAETKFSLGHIVEAYTITLAKAAGHDVKGEQHECELDGVKGHIDCILDGCVVDIKSAATRSFQQIKSGGLGVSDLWGYLDQLDGYVGAMSSIPGLAVDPTRGYILAVDKQLGHMTLYEHTIRHGRIQQRIAECKRVVEANQPPACTCGTAVHGASGNIALDPKASYSAYKWSCWPGLRCFLYSDGPKYFTAVVRRPEHFGAPLTEVDKFGNVVRA